MSIHSDLSVCLYVVVTSQYKMVLGVALPQFDGFVVFEGSRGDDVFRGVACCAQDDVGVSLQLLDDLFGLQVPDVHQVVFAAGDDPLAARDREVGEDAVLFVLVLGVRLQALALRVVPQLQGVVQRGRQNVLACKGKSILILEPPEKQTK